MKKLLLLTSLFYMCNFVLLSQVGFSDSCKVNPKSYKVIVKENAFQHVDSKHVIPRELKESEFCRIIKNRHESETVIMSLDKYHEIIIFPYSVIE